MARTFPTDGVSPCDFYGHGKPTRALGHFQWDLTGATIPAADACVLLDINDATTISTGTINGLKIDYAASGTKTGGTVQPLAVNLAVTANTIYAYGIRVDTQAVANKTMEMLMGIDVYMRDPGTAVSRYFALNLGMVNTSTAAGEVGFIRMRNHGTTTMNTAFQLEGSNPCTHLFAVPSNLPFHSSQVSVQNGRIGIRIGTSTQYLAVYDS